MGLLSVLEGPNSDFIPSKSPDINLNVEINIPSLLSNMLQDGLLKELPRGYLCPEYTRPTVTYDEYDESVLTDIPVIDLGLLNCGKPNAGNILLGNLQRACEEWGFFYLINHGVPKSHVQAMQKQARQFFSLPHHQKRRAHIPGQRLGYHSMQPTTTPSPSLHWSEGFTMKGLAGHVHCSEFATRIWPQGQEKFGFCDVVEEYTKSMVGLEMKLRDLIIESLGVDSKHFKQYCNPSFSSLHLNYYPTCPQPTNVVGMGAHYDMGFFTLLAHDDVGGLQVQHGGKWVNVKPRSDAFTVNIGDMLQALTNGRYKSIKHRAVVNESRERYSIAYFLSVNPRLDLNPAPELVDEQHPRLYKPFTFLDIYTSVRNKHLDELSRGAQVLEFLRASS
ncbi:hypothetical protein R1flu_018960 [Riccia fluitans]|uniref:Fe2OG dioxygenase domain-containing protein n=1 Tax=Riccia fluitans TaxID=41844 RepID=A0ABD1ZHJ2_9MARC